MSPSVSPTQCASRTTSVEGKLGEVLNIPPLCTPMTQELSVSSPQHNMSLGAAALAHIPAVSLPKQLPLTFIVRKTREALNIPLLPIPSAQELPMGFLCCVMIQGALFAPPHSLPLATSCARQPPFTYAVDDHQEVLNTPLPSVFTQ